MLPRFNSSKAIALIAFIVAIALTHASARAQNLVFDSPETASQIRDFAVQGEYSGDSRALQVVALGDGEYAIAIYEGGLPGDGWRGEAARRIEGDEDTVMQLIDSMSLKKVDRQSPTLGANPPAGAIHLFSGSQESIVEHWLPGAKITDDGLLIEGATTKENFKDFVLHLEFRTPFMPNASGQQRGNSGVYHQGRYENQILDSFGLEGSKNETGAIYDIKAPDINACFPPLAWQTYDVVFTAATYDQSGNKLTNAKMTTRLNGVVVQNEVSVPDATRAAPLAESDSPGPIHLQNHGNPVRFRNIWILPRDAQREARRPIVPGFERFYSSSQNSTSTNSAAVSEPTNPGALPVDDLAVGGEILISNLGCVNCHAEPTMVWQPLRGPELTNVASRVRPDFLVEWLTSPHETKPGTTMPDVLATLEPEKKASASKALASYLLLAGDRTDYSDPVGDATAAQRGEVLYHSIGCVACHASQNGEPTPTATSVPLGKLEKKYTLASLTKFLQNPHAVRPSGRMPKLVGEPGEARDLATYLLREVVVVPGAQQFVRSVYRGSWDKLPDFSKESPIGEPSTVTGLTFDGIAPLDGFAAVYEAFLPIQQSGTYTLIIGSDDGSRVLVDDKEVVRVDGIHPYQQRSGKIDLEAGVHRLKVEYFEQGGEERLTLEIEGGDIGKTNVASFVTLDPSGAANQELIATTFKADPSLLEEGRQLFVTTGCANCHEMREGEKAIQSSLVARPLVEIRNPRTRNFLQGCVADTPAAGLPNYQLSPQQQNALRRALAAVIEKNAEGRASDAINIHATLVAANCYACHERSGLGGPESARDAYFQTTTMEMGNEGRLPPPLTGVADKLTDKFVAKYLEEGANERPYMKTRMPGFGYDGLKALHESMIRLDRATDTMLPEAAQSIGRLKADGRTLVGNDGLACVKCHTFNGEGTPGIQAIDMLKMTDRLRQDWFHRYLLDPQKYRPGTRMPASFPDGVSVLKTVADGEPAYQIQAMWEYLKDGKQAKIPSGLRPGAIELIPTTRPIIYRNFLTDLTPRGIAVGYPEGVNLAWDANSMSLRKIWQNQFLDASLHWQGRGPGNLGPLGDLVQVLPGTAPVANLETIDAAWPDKTDDSSDYQFRGYKLDKAGRPGFQYTVGELHVTETFSPVAAEDGSKTLVRELSLEGSAERVYVRFASGEIQPESDGWYLVNNAYRIQVVNAEVKLVMVNGQAELRSEVHSQQPTKIVSSIRW